MAFALTFVLLVTGLFAKDGPQQQGEALLKRAVELHNLKSSGAQPFRLRMNLRAKVLQGSDQQGIYELVWASPQKWREEIRIGDFEQFKIGGTAKFWQQRSVPFQPTRVHQLTSLLKILDLQVPPQVRFRKVHEESRKGRRETCADWKALEWNTEGTECFDSITGALLRREQRTNVSETREYEDYSAFGQKLYPRTLRLIHGGFAVVEATVDELASLTSVDESWFVPPTGAQEWATCDDMQPPKGKSMPDPSPAESCRENDRGSWAMGRGTVALSVVVEPDGKPSDIAVVESSGQNFEKPVLEAVRQWRFKPAKCGATPVRTEIRIEMSIPCIAVFYGK